MRRRFRSRTFPRLSPKIHNENASTDFVMSVTSLLSDSFGRVMRDLRVSLTDRCNFRCLYCLPETEEAANFYRTRFDALKNPNPKFLPLPALKPRNEILTLEEIERIVRVAVSLGIEKIRLTGGEPL